MYTHIEHEPLYISPSCRSTGDWGDESVKTGCTSYGEPVTETVPPSTQSPDMFTSPDPLALVLVAYLFCFRLLPMSLIVIKKMI